MVLWPYPKDPRLGPYLEGKGQVNYVGARFEALFMGVLMAIGGLGFFLFPNLWIRTM